MTREEEGVEAEVRRRVLSHEAEMTASARGGQLSARRGRGERGGLRSVENSTLLTGASWRTAREDSPELKSALRGVPQLGRREGGGRRDEQSDLVRDSSGVDVRVVCSPRYI